MFKKIIKTFRTYFIDYTRYRKILNSDPCFDSDEKVDEYYIFNTVRNTTIVMHIEFFLAFSLAKRGHKSIVLLDDGVLRHWDSIHDINHNRSLTPYRAGFFRRWYTKLHTLILCRLYSHKLITYTFISDLLSGVDTDSIDISEYNEIIESAAKSSCRRYSSNPSFWDDYKNQNYYKMSYENGVIFALVALVLQAKYPIKKLITSHAIYSCWAVLFEVLKKSDVPVLMYSELIYRGQYAIFSDQPVQNLSHGEEWGNILGGAGATMEECNRQQMVEFYQKRINYEGYEHKYYFQKNELLSKEVARDSNTVVFGMFPNIVWDGDIEEWHIIFDGILDWVQKTILLIKDTKNILVIRCHPAEAKLLGHSPKLEDILRAAIPNLDSMGNIVIISSDTRLDVYGFIQDQIDIGLVYDGILGMEMAFMGKPVISAGSGRYAGSYFSEEPQSLTEYTEMMLHPKSVIERAIAERSVRLERLLRFSWWYLHEKTYFIPILDKDDFFGVKIGNIDEMTFSPKNRDFQRTLEFLTDE